MEVDPNQQPLSAASLARTQVAVQVVAVSSYVICWSFRWMRRSKRAGMDVRAEDWLALVALVALSAYTVMLVFYGFVCHADIPPASRLPLQCGIVLTQGSQALYCANTIRHIGHVEGNRNDKVTKVIQVIKRKGLDHALSWTIIILGLATVVLLIFGLFVATHFSIAILATAVIFLTECMTSGFLIFTLWILRALLRPANYSRRVNWVQLLSIVLWLGRVWATFSSLVVTCVAAAAPSLVPSNKLELVLLIVVGYLVVVAPGAGPLSAGRQWYLRRDRSKPYDAAAEFSPYPDSKSADAALDGTANNAEDAGSVNGSTAPLTGCHAGDGVSTTKAIDCCDSQRSISSTTSTDATLWKGSTSAAPLPLTAIVFDEPYGRHGEGKTSLSLGNYHILRHHKLSGGSVWQLTEILKQGAKGWYELTDGSIEIIVHKDDRGRLVDSLHKTFPASAIDSTYNPLAANADKPVHVARYEYICKMDEIKKRLGPSSLLAAIYEHWLQEWSKEQDKH